jgi:hypothetical protein
MTFTTKGTPIGATPLIALAFLLLAGCGTVYVPAYDPNLVVKLATTEIKVPPGDGWAYFREKEKDSMYVAFWRRGETPSHQFLADVMEVKRPAELEAPGDIGPSLLRPVVRDYFGVRKFKITKEEVVADTRFGDLCARFVVVAKDYEAPGRGDAEYLELRMWGYAFVHPAHADIAVVIAMNERGHAEEFHAENETVAEGFFSGLTLR